eukprot:scaffold3283_cov237-Pinguiococcus_pyrenoidosus.AAC.8
MSLVAAVGRACCLSRRSGRCDPRKPSHESHRAPAPRTVLVACTAARTAARSGGAGCLPPSREERRPSARYSIKRSEPRVRRRPRPRQSPLGSRRTPETSAQRATRGPEQPAGSSAEKRLPSACRDTLTRHGSLRAGGRQPCARVGEWPADALCVCQKFEEQIPSGGRLCGARENKAPEWFGD